MNEEGISEPCARESCSRMILFHLKTCTPMKATPLEALSALFDASCGSTNLEGSNDRPSVAHILILLLGAGDI